MIKELIKIGLRAIVVFVSFIVVLGALNIFNTSSNSPLINLITSYVNSNAWILILMFLTVIISQILYTRKFPTNLPAPFLQAIPATYAVLFCFGLLAIVTASTKKAINPEWGMFYIAPFLFVGILFVGYLKILNSKSKQKSKRKK